MIVLGAAIILAAVFGFAALLARHVWRSRTTIDFRDRIDNDKAGWA